MNKDQVQGRVDEAKGHVKEAAGNLTGNDRLKGEGKVDQVSGKTQGTFGDAKEKVKGAIDKV